VAWRDIAIAIAINSVLKEGRGQTFPLSMSLAQRPPNISNQQTTYHSVPSFLTGITISDKCCFDIF
jgi:hypothetical protein